MRWFFYLSLVVVISACAFSLQAEPINSFRAEFSDSYVLYLGHEQNHVYFSIETSTQEWAEIDLGPSLYLQGAAIYPLIGMDFSGSPVKKSSTIPQLYMFYCNSLVDFGSWNMLYLNQAGNFFYYRDFLMIKSPVAGTWIGPQIEGTLTEEEKGYFIGSQMKYAIRPNGEISGFLGWNKDGTSMYRLGYFTTF